MISKALLVSKSVFGQSEKGIRKTDEKDGLEVYSADLPVRENFEYDVRGLVFKDGNLFFRSPPHAREEVPEDLDISRFSISVMREGSVIRVFMNDGEWLVTTNRKLDAYRSKWGNGKSFGEMFEDSIDNAMGISLTEFLDRLDKNIGYVFLIGTNENTRVVSPQYDGLVILDSFDMKSLERTRDENMSHMYVPESNFSCVQDARDFVESLEYPFEFGHGIFMQSENKSYKIENSKYLELSALRNNLPSIMFAYLHNCFDEKKSAWFETIYKDLISEFRFYDSEIKAIACDLLSKYINKFIHKNPVEVSKPEGTVLYGIHGLYLKDRKKISFGDVMWVLESQNPSVLNKIIGERKRKRLLALKATE